MKQDKADGVLEVLLEYGINHIDTAASYGESELRIGPWMREHRKRFFLATKTGDRTYQGARDSLHRSLERLRVDQVDLIQMHNLVAENEWATALGAGGALEALVEARTQGLVRFIGVTGHGSQVAAMHRRSLERFPFDSVLFPYNFTMLNIDQYAADAEALLKVCRERNVATQTIKSVARRRWQNGDGRKFSWYEPLRDRDAIRRGVHFVLSRPGPVPEHVERRDPPARHPRRGEHESYRSQRAQRWKPTSRATRWSRCSSQECRTQSNFFPSPRMGEDRR